MKQVPLFSDPRFSALVFGEPPPRPAHPVRLEPGGAWADAIVRERGEYARKEADRLVQRGFSPPSRDEVETWQKALARQLNRFVGRDVGAISLKQVRRADGADGWQLFRIFMLRFEDGPAVMVWLGSMEVGVGWAGKPMHYAPFEALPGAAVYRPVRERVERLRMGRE